MAEKLPEVWLRGALPNIPPLLQPVAHALLQAREEVVELMKDFPDQLLWIRPANAASVGFHLQHLSGVLDRLFTYANGNSLTEQQLTALKAEGNPHITKAGSAELVGQFNSQVDKALDALKKFDQKTLTDFRGV
ncbi:MAG: DinB family protein, partial [Flavisolibacter sp.]